MPSERCMDVDCSLQWTEMIYRDGGMDLITFLAAADSSARTILELTAS